MTSHLPEITTAAFLMVVVIIPSAVALWVIIVGDKL